MQQTFLPQCDIESLPTSNLDKSRIGGDVMEGTEAIRQLFEAYSKDVYRYAKLSLNGYYDPNDVVQEVFYRAYKAWNSFRHESNPKTWLFAIARNYIWDLQRKQRSDSAFTSDTDLLLLRNTAVSPDRMLVIQEAISELKETYRTMVLLRHVECFTVSETAKILGWSESKVTTTDHRALAKLKILLNSDEQGVASKHER